MSILTEAEELINGQRAIDYGDARENHQNIADLWSVYFGAKFSPEDVAVMMILLKVARFMANGYHEDTVRDIAGYAGVLEKMQPSKKMLWEVFADEPRVWDSLDDVPIDTQVVDPQGDVWWFNTHDGEWTFSGNRANHPVSFYPGPFVEVLDADE